MDDTQGVIAKIIKRCWEDAKFQQRFVSQPNSVLKEYGVDVPADLEIKVVLNTDNVHYLAVPTKPGDQLSDASLDAVVGGAISPTFAHKIAIKKLTGMGGPGTHDPGPYCIPYPC